MTDVTTSAAKLASLRPAARIVVADAATEVSGEQQAALIGGIPPSDLPAATETLGGIMSPELFARSGMIDTRSPEEFGAVRDGGTDDAAAMQAAVAALALAGGGTLMLSPGAYALETALEVDGIDLTIRWHGASIEWGGAGAAVKVVNGGTVAFDPPLDPRLFGAVPDGATEATSAFQAAIDTAAALAKTVHVSEGVFSLGSLDLVEDRGAGLPRQKVEMVGAGRDLTFLKFHENLSDPLLSCAPDISVKLGRVHISKLTIDGDGKSGTALFLNNLTKCHFSELVIQNVKGIGIHARRFWDSSFFDVMLDNCGDFLAKKPSIRFENEDPDDEDGSVNNLGLYDIHVENQPYRALEMLHGTRKINLTRFKHHATPNYNVVVLPYHTRTGAFAIGEEVSDAGTPARVGEVIAIDAVGTIGALTVQVNGTGVFGAGDALTGDASGAATLSTTGGAVASGGDAVLVYRSKTADFTVGETVENADLDASGDVVSVTDYGDWGILVLDTVTGTFAAGDVLDGDEGGGAIVASGSEIAVGQGGIYIDHLNVASQPPRDIDLVTPNLSVCPGPSLSLRNTGGTAGTGPRGIKVTGGSIAADRLVGLQARCCQSLTISQTSFRTSLSSSTCIDLHADAHGVRFDLATIDFDLNNSGFKFRYDHPSFRGRFDVRVCEIVGGTITAFGSAMILDAEGRSGTTGDFLDRIDGGTHGARIMLRAGNDGRTITIRPKTAGGVVSGANIRTGGLVFRDLGSFADVICLAYDEDLDGGVWVETSFQKQVA